MLRKKIILKFTALSIASLLGGVTFATNTAYASDDTQSINIKELSYDYFETQPSTYEENDNSKFSSNYTYRMLNQNKKDEFNNLVNSGVFSDDELIEILKQREINNPSSIIGESKWKTSVIKKAAKLIAAKTGEKSLADITDFLFGWEGDLQDGIEYYLINSAGFNESVAHWTAKSIMFLLF